MRFLLQWSPLPQARQLKELPYSQTGKVERWYWAGPPMFGKPCSSYIFLQSRKSRPRLQQGESSTGDRKWEGRRKRKGGVGKVSMTVHNLCFFSSPQTYNQEEPWSGMVTGLPRPEDFYQQTSCMTALLQGGDPLP